MGDFQIAQWVITIVFAIVEITLIAWLVWQVATVWRGMMFYKVVAIGENGNEGKWFKGNSLNSAFREFLLLKQKVIASLGEQFYYRVDFPVTKIELRLHSDKEAYTVINEWEASSG